MRVIQFTLEEYSQFFDFVYFDLSNVRKHLKKDDNTMINYIVYKDHVCKKIKCDAKYSDYIIYDYIALRYTVILIEKILLDIGVKRHQIHIMGVPNIDAHVLATQRHRCAGLYDVINQIG